MTDRRPTPRRSWSYLVELPDLGHDKCKIGAVGIDAVIVGEGGR
jgi:hypothetical protein